MPLPRHPTPQVIHDDGTIWEASWEVSKDGADLWHLGFTNPGRAFYFRQIELNPDRKWWCPWRPMWRRTGRTFCDPYPFEEGFHVLSIGVHPAYQHIAPSLPRPLTL